MTHPLARVMSLDGHKIGVGDLLDAEFHDELWRTAPASSGLVICDWPYNCVSDNAEVVRLKAAGFRKNGKYMMETWDQYEGDWGRYCHDLDLWLEAACRRRAKHSALIGWGWSQSLPYLLDAGKRHGLKLVTVFTWAKQNASPRFAKNCIITKSTEFAVIWRGRAKLDVFPPLIRDHVVYSPNRTKLDTKHQSPKPLPVWQPLIERFAPPGGVVYDPFLGSGTTLIACRASGRVAVCADREEWCVRESLARYGAKTDGLLGGRQASLWDSATT